MPSKSKQNVTVVGPKAIRALFHEGVLNADEVTVTKTVKGVDTQVPADQSSLYSGPQGRGRGRLAQPFIKAGLAHFGEGTVYAEKVEGSKTVEVPALNKKGHRTGRNKTIPLSEFRTLTGQKMGKPSAENVAKAARALAGLTD